MHQLSSFHQTKTGLLLFGLMELSLAYVFASWAIDKGNLLDYILTLVLFVGAIQNLIKLIILYFNS